MSRRPRFALLLLLLLLLRKGHLLAINCVTAHNSTVTFSLKNSACITVRSVNVTRGGCSVRHKNSMRLRHQ